MEKRKLEREHEQLVRIKEELDEKCENHGAMENRLVKQHEEITLNMNRQNAEIAKLGERIQGSKDEKEAALVKKLEIEERTSSLQEEKNTLNAAIEEI